MKSRQLIFGATLLAAAAVALAAAGQGLKWSASSTYEDGTPLATTDKVVYVVYTQEGKQVYSTFNLQAAASALPTDGCYYVTAWLYSQDINGVIPASGSKPTAVKCTTTTPPQPIQKRVAAPLDFDIVK